MLEKTFTTYLSEALHTIMQEKDNPPPLDTSPKTNTSTGIIENLAGLVKNLFPLGK